MTKQEHRTRPRARSVGEARERLVADLPLTEQRRDVAGVSTAVLAGGDGPPVVFLQPEFALVWMRIIPGLVSTHRVVAPDLPGQGESGSARGRFDVDAALTWLSDLIAQTCDAPPTLIGKAPGGALAARFAVEHGDQLDRLVLVDSHGLDRFRPPPGLAWSFASTLLRPTQERVERSFRTYCLTDTTGFAPRWDSPGTG